MIRRACCSRLDGRDRADDACAHPGLTRHMGQHDSPANPRGDRVYAPYALDQLGRRLGEIELATTRAGYQRLLAWAERLGAVEAFGIEGTGCYGAGLARHLRARKVCVIEVMRPNRQTRRRKGKSDPTDAEAAARAVLSAEAAGSPKAGDDLVEMIRVLRVARSTAIKARTQAINALRALLVTAPPELRDELRALSTSGLVTKAAQVRPGERLNTLAASKLALRHLARRCQALQAETQSLDAQLAQLTATASPHLAEAVRDRRRHGRCAAGRRRRQP